MNFSLIANPILLIVIAILPVIILMFYVHKKDKNKEPVGLLVKLFFAGVSSCFLVIFISRIISPFLPFMQIDTSKQNNFLDVLLYSFVGVALIEECCKFLMAYTIGYRNKDFDEIYDMMVYSIFVALGFAGFENILYVLKGGIRVGISRALLSVPGHACDGLFMGYYLSLAKMSSVGKDKEEERNNIIKAIAVPTLLHGIYDFCCFAKIDNIFIVFLIFVIIMYIFAVKKLNYVAKNNRNIFMKKKPLVEILEQTELANGVTLTKEEIKNNNNSSKPSQKNKPSEYFTIETRRIAPTIDNKGENFKFENTGVPYVPDPFKKENIDYAPPITEEQSAGYISEETLKEMSQSIPEISEEQVRESISNNSNSTKEEINISQGNGNNQISEPIRKELSNNPSLEEFYSNSFCVYCGAKLTPYCSSCGHKVKE